MRCRTKGFTLIELMIVIAIIAIIAAISIPNLLAARLSANETAAMASLRAIFSAQEQFRMGAALDADGNGVGEYGGFLEMSGGRPGRLKAVLVPPVVSGSYRIINRNGEVARSGYFFKVFLPGPNGEGIGEQESGFKGGTADASLSEITWCAYAWPINYNQSGNRTFFMNSSGDVMGTEDAQYSGTGRGPAVDAAFLPEGKGKITGAPAFFTVAVDGNTWRLVN